MKPDLLNNDGKSHNLSVLSHVDNTFWLNDDVQEFKNPFLQEDSSHNDFGFSAYGFNQNLWINWEQSYQFDCNLSSDSAAQGHKIEKQRLSSNLDTKLQNMVTSQDSKNMNHEYYDESKLLKCNVHNSKEDNLIYSRKVSIDQALSPYSCQSKDTQSTSIQNPFLQTVSPKVVNYGLNSQAQSFAYSNTSTINWVFNSFYILIKNWIIVINCNIDIMVEDILTSTLPKNKQVKGNEPRKDLVNKNIIRIISRFFKAKFKDTFPSFSYWLKDSEILINLLQEFCMKLFPKYQENSKPNNLITSELSDNQNSKIKGKYESWSGFQNR